PMRTFMSAHSRGEIFSRPPPVLPAWHWHQRLHCPHLPWQRVINQDCSVAHRLLPFPGEQSCWAKARNCFTCSCRPPTPSPLPLTISRGASDGRLDTAPVPSPMTVANHP